MGLLLGRLGEGGRWSDGETAIEPESAQKQRSSEPGEISTDKESSAFGHDLAEKQLPQVLVGGWWEGQEEWV